MILRFMNLFKETYARLAKFLCMCHDTSPFVSGIMSATKFLCMCHDTSPSAACIRHNECDDELKTPHVEQSRVIL